MFTENNTKEKRAAQKESSGYLLRATPESSACLPEKEPFTRPRKNILRDCTGLVSIPSIQSGKTFHKASGELCHNSGIKLALD